MVSCKLAGDIGIERSGSLSTESDQRGDGDAGFAALFKLHFKFIIIFTPVDEISRVAFTPFTFFCIEFAGGGGGGGAAAAAATAIAAVFSPSFVVVNSKLRCPVSVDRFSPTFFITAIFNISLLSRVIQRRPMVSRAITVECPHLND